MNGREPTKIVESNNAISLIWTINNGTGKLLFVIAGIRIGFTSWNIDAIVIPIVRKHKKEQIWSISIFISLNLFLLVFCPNYNKPSMQKKKYL
jgi:hypothetical protein